MASKIVPTNIDGTFPVAGQDNSSQGFRDNFTNIKNNFTFARNEIGDLQDNVLLKSALPGTTLNNDMAGTQLTRPQLRAWTQALVDLGAIDGSAVVNFSSGNFQKITTAGNISLSLINWPSSAGEGALGYGSMRVWFVVGATGGVPHTVTLPASVTIGAIDIAGYNATTRTITFDVPGNYVFDFSSVDGGSNFLIFDLTRNRVQFRDPSFYFNADVSPTFLIGFQDSLSLALTLATGNDTLQLRGSQTNYSGVLEHGNDQGIGIFSGNPLYEGLAGNAAVAGYSVGTSRAYVNPTTGLPVYDQTALIQSNDYIGYLNFIAPTFNPLALPTPDISICDFSSIRSFANGVSAFSPGGNLVISTKRDTVTSGGILTPAVSIENDQAVHFFGATVAHNAEVSAGYQFANVSATPVVSIGANTSVVLIDSTLGATVASANIQLPPAIGTRDGQTLTIASNSAITTAAFVSSQTATYASSSVVSGFNVVTMTTNPYIQPGMFITSGASYISGQFILSIVDNGPITANVIISAAADSAPSPGATLTFSTGTSVSGAPSSYTANQSGKWIYRAANQRWYKIG
jgi:hypothetical protein